MRDIDDYFSTASPTLYHYTGVGALLGINSSSAIFATHAYYLNDSREITYATSQLVDAAAAFDCCIDGVEHEVLSQFIRWLDRLRQPLPIFIFSLSEEASLLSQWRSYTPHGKGVSLGFSSALIQQLLEVNQCRLARCLYESSQHTELVRSLLEKLFVSFRDERNDLDVSKEHHATCYHKFFEKFLGNLLQVLSIIKHPSFAEEREWRVISTYRPDLKSSEMEHREGSSMLIPYTRLKLQRLASERFLFERIVMGPSPDQNLAMTSLGTFNRMNDLSQHLSNCAIPYRKW